MKSTELVIDVLKDSVKIALIEDRRLVEFREEKNSNMFSLGDMYLARVKKVQPTLNAAFLDLGYSRDAFLHYKDLKGRFHSVTKFLRLRSKGKIKNSDLSDFHPDPVFDDKDGNIRSYLEVGQVVLVRIDKEPISTKGPRLDLDVALAGRYLILIPFDDDVRMSRKIGYGKREEKKRLHRLVSSIKPKGFGVIIRTVAEGRSSEELDVDLRELLAKWGECYKTLSPQTIREVNGSFKIYSESSRVESTLRDIFHENFSKVVVNDAKIYGEIQSYIERFHPDKKGIVKHHRSGTPILEHYNVSRQVRQSFGDTVTVGGGIYIVIQQTEALCSIDVNSGSRISSASETREDKEETIFEVNRSSATEIARQLRLRDIGGIIVVDFIDMKQQAHTDKLYQHLKEVMKPDRVKHKILPPTQFGLVQITRQRVRPLVRIDTREPMKTDKTPLGAVEEILDKLGVYFSKNHTFRIFLHVHPFVRAYLRQGIFSRQCSICLKHRFLLSIKERHDYHITQYKFFDAKNNSLEL